MIVTLVIGLILSLLGIYLFKGSRTRSGEPILRVWSLLLYFLGALMRLFNILMGIVMIVYWSISVYGDRDWTYPEKSIVNKIAQFLNKSVK